MLPCAWLSKGGRWSRGRSKSSSSSSKMSCWTQAVLFLFIFIAQGHQGHASCLMPTGRGATATAAAAAEDSRRLERLLLHGNSTRASLVPLEGERDPRRLLAGHLFSSSGLRSLPWVSETDNAEVPTEEQQEEEQDGLLDATKLQKQLQQQQQKLPVKAKALSHGALQALRGVRHSVAAAAAAAGEKAAAAAAAAIPKDELGQRLLSGVVTRLYVQTLLYPIVYLLLLLLLQGLSLSALYEGALPALLLGDVPYSLICGLLHAKASSALKKHAPRLPPLVASALAAVCADTAGVIYKTPHDAMKVLRQRGLAANASQALQMTAAAAPTLQRAVPVTIVRDAFFRIVNGLTAERIRNVLLSRRQRSLRNDGASEEDERPVMAVDTPEQPEENSGYLGLRGIGRWIQTRGAFWKNRACVDRAVEAARLAAEQKARMSRRLRPSSSDYAEAAMVGGLSAGLAGIAASPLDAARALVVKEAAADSKNWETYAGFPGVARALHQAAVTGGLKGLLATAPLRVLLGGCCGALAAAFNLRCTAALCALREIAEKNEAAKTATAPAA
ncbi:hypothetical protein Esti_006044 [Eimeria stiedai]